MPFSDTQTQNGCVPVPAPSPAGKTNKLGRPPAPSESHQFQASSDLLPTGYCTVRTPAVLPYDTASSSMWMHAATVQRHCRHETCSGARPAGGGAGAFARDQRAIHQRRPESWWGAHPTWPGHSCCHGLMGSSHACMDAARDRPLTRRRSRGRSLRRLARLKGGRPALRGSSTTPVAPYYVLTLFFLVVTSGIVHGWQRHWYGGVAVGGR